MADSGPARHQGSTWRSATGSTSCSARRGFPTRRSRERFRGAEQQIEQLFGQDSAPPARRPQLNLAT